MTEQRMPTTLPSAVDRGEFLFVAVGAAGDEWRWIDEEMVWVRVSRKGERDDSERERCVVLH